MELRHLRYFLAVAEELLGEEAISTREDDGLCEQTVTNDSPSETEASPIKITHVLQPVFRHDRGKFHVVFFEFLLRVFFNDIGPSVHADIITVAEQLRIVHIIDGYVLERLICVLGEHPNMRASINISQRSVVNHGEIIIERLRASGLSSRIIVEITETSSAPLEALQRFAEELHKIGSHVAVDDFEMGSIDATVARAVRPNFVKVVLEDISTFLKMRLDRATELASELGAIVVVEGIDSNEKLQIVSAGAEHYIQGHLLGEPIFLQDLPEYFRNNQ